MKLILNLCNDVGTYFQHDTYTDAHKRYKRWLKKGEYTTNRWWCKKCFHKYVSLTVPFAMGQVQPVLIDSLYVVNCVCCHVDETVFVGDTPINVDGIRIEPLAMCILRCCDIAIRIGGNLITYNSSHIENSVKSITDRFKIGYINIELK